jgi:hypothetical protein
MSRWDALPRYALLLIVVIAGCKMPPRAVEPPPPAPEPSPRVTFADLAPGVTPPAGDFALLADIHSAGRFSCSLAIAKFVPQAGAAQALTFVAIPRNEQAYWLEQMVGVEAIRDVQFLRPITTRPEGQELSALCAAARKLKAPLLLVYAQDFPDAHDAAIWGVLYEAGGGRALATLHAAQQSASIDPNAVPLDSLVGDHRGADPRFQAQRAFEAHTLACLRDLIHLDQPPPSTQPHRWQTPLIERWWIDYR